MLFCYTFFSSIIDFARGEIYPEEKYLKEELQNNYSGYLFCLKTQKRRMIKFISMFGLLKTSKKRAREKIANLLDIDLSILEDAHRKINSNVCRRLLTDIGKIGVAILKSLVAAKYSKLIELGSIRRLWGKVVYAVYN